MWRSFNWVTGKTINIFTLTTDYLTLGYQIRAVTSAAKHSYNLSFEENKESVQKISRSLFYASQLKHRTMRVLNEYVWALGLHLYSTEIPPRFRQKFVTILYLMMKVSYLFLIVFHLAVFKHFIGNLDFAFGFVRNPGEWEQTGLFPRVTVCDFTVN